MDIETKKWVYGDLIHQCLVGSFIVPTAIKELGFMPVEVLPKTVGQFTGLLDKNQKEIYSGDIDKNKGVVVWMQDTCEYVFEKENGYKCLTQCMTDEVEIIGNTFENGDLLK